MNQLSAVDQSTAKTTLSSLKSASKLIIFASLLLVAGVALLQTSSSSGRQFLRARELQETTTFPSISWADYHAKPDSSMTFWAYTIWNTPYTYDNYEDGDGMRVVVDCRCVLSQKKSWVKPGYQSQELLRHENGHFQIGSIMAMTFKKQADSMTFSKDNYDSELSNLYNKILKYYLAYEIRYDAETNHFKNKPMQQQWENDLIDQINALKDYWWTGNDNNNNQAENTNANNNNNNPIVIEEPITNTNTNTNNNVEEEEEEETTNTNTNTNNNSYPEEEEEEEDSNNNNNNNYEPVEEEEEEEESNNNNNSNSPNINHYWEPEEEEEEPHYNNNNNNNNDNYNNNNNGGNNGGGGGRNGGGGGSNGGNNGGGGGRNGGGGGSNGGGGGRNGGGGGNGGNGGR